MNTKTTADAVVRHLERSIPVYSVSDHGYSVSDHGYSTLVSLVDGRSFFVDAPFEGDVVITPAARTLEGDLALLEDLDAELTEAGFDVRQVVCCRTCLLELRVRDDVGGWDR